MGILAFSHNPGTLLQWIWVVLAYGIVVVIVGLAVALAVRAVLVARSSGRGEDRPPR